MHEQIMTWIQKKELLRIRYVQQKMGPETVVGRILSANQDHFIIYDDDLKKVLHLSMYEIDDIQSSNHC